MGRHIDEEKVQELRRLIIEGGHTNQEIADTVGVGISTVVYHKQKLRDEKVIEELKCSESNERLKWLIKNWKFDKSILKKKEKKSDYRVVHSGERGRLRTPYRPDGRFR